MRRCCGLDRANPDGRNGARLWAGRRRDAWQLGGVRFAEDADNKPLVTKLLAALVRADAISYVIWRGQGRQGPINDKTRPLLEIIAKYTNLPVEQVVGNAPI